MNAAITDLGNEDLAVRWLRSQDSPWGQRALLIPNKGTLHSITNAAVKKYAENNNVGANRGTSASSGGPVLALSPDYKLLESAVHLAGANPLAVVEHIPGEIAGWAACTGAVDLATGEPTPPVPDEIAELLQDLDEAGYNGYHRKEEFFRAKFQGPISGLIAAGYDYRFVASYLIALGASSQRVDDLKKIYK